MTYYKITALIAAILWVGCFIILPKEAISLSIIPAGITGYSIGKLEEPRRQK